MIYLRFNRKREKSNFEKTLLQLAVTPAALNISMLSEEARIVLEQYLQAVYACRVELLPLEKMEETCYRETLQRIKKRKKSSLVPQIQSFTMEDYDRRVMYKVMRITYRAVYSIQESENQYKSWNMAVVFDFDERLGWLLGSVREQ